MNWNGYTIFQNEEFLNIYCKGKNFEIIELGGCLGYLHKFPILGYTFMKIPFPNEFRIDEILRICNTYNVAWLEIVTSHKDDNLSKYLDTTEGTFVIDLNKNMDDLWKKLDHHTRKNINRARNKNVIIEQTHSIEDFDKWWRLYIKTADEKGFIALPYHLVRDVFIINNLSKLFVAKVDGNMIAGRLLLIDVSPLSWLSCTDRKYSEYKASSLLQWENILWSKSLGYPYYDLGGAVINKEHGPTQFKKDFGGDYKEYYMYNIPFNGFKSRILRLAFGGYYIVKNFRYRGE
jgi:lipid II:glycine glycyltransferase (peptidoglycan interpeptide bridge formation enzyme)